MDVFGHELDPPPPSNCVNCSVDFSKVSGAVSEIHIFSASNEFERSVSLLEALAAIFTSKNLLRAQERNYRVVMCPKCAEVVSNIYRDYLNLLQLSKAAGYVCRLVSQIHTWHQFHDEGQGHGQIMVETEEGVFSPAVYTLDDDDDDDRVEDYGDNETQIIVTDLFNLVPDATVNVLSTLESVESPPRRSPKKTKKGSAAALKERYRKKALSKKKTTKKRSDGEKSDQPGEKKKSTRYKCRFINKRQFVTCKSCPETFLYNWRLHEHYLLAHDEKIRDECSGCGFQYFPEIIKPETHSCLTDAHHFPKSKQKPVLCEICGERFRVERMLLFHLEKVHVQEEVKFQCIHCGRHVKNRTKLCLHMETHNPEKKYLCPQCGMAFAQRRGLDKHRLTHSDVYLPCETCGKLLKTKDSLASHIRTVHGIGKAKTEDPTEPQEPMVCEVCDKEFKGKRNLREHFKYMHTGEESKKFVCNVCDKREYSSSKLKRHMRMHLSARERKQLKLKTSEASSNPSVKEVGPFKCDVCGRQYNYKNYLIDHIKLTHQPTLAKAQCSICFKPFLHPRDVEAHERTHMNQEELDSLPKVEKPPKLEFPAEAENFPCPEPGCGKVFNSKRNAIGHHRYMHTNTEMKQCTYCDATVRAVLLRRHIQRQHSQAEKRIGRKRKSIKTVELRSGSENEESQEETDVSDEEVSDQSSDQSEEPSPPPAKTSKSKGQASSTKPKSKQSSSNQLTTTGRTSAKTKLTPKSHPSDQSEISKSMMTLAKSMPGSLSSQIAALIRQHEASRPSPAKRPRQREVRRPARYASNSEAEAESEHELITPDLPPVPKSKITTPARGRGRPPKKVTPVPKTPTRLLKVKMERDSDIEEAVSSGKLTVTRRSSRRFSEKSEPKTPEPDPDSDDTEEDEKSQFILG